MFTIRVVSHDVVKRTEREYQRLLGLGKPREIGPTEKESKVLTQVPNGRGTFLEETGSTQYDTDV